MTNRDEHETMFDEARTSWSWMNDHELVLKVLLDSPLDSLEYELARRLEKRLNQLERREM